MIMLSARHDRRHRLIAIANKHFFAIAQHSM